jgi:hypothetical protein
MSGEHLHPSGNPTPPDTPQRVLPGPDLQPDNMERTAVAELAYQFWELRGRPAGSPEEDWFRAERELKKSREWALEAAADAARPPAAEAARPPEKSGGTRARARR